MKQNFFLSKIYQRKPFIEFSPKKELDKNLESEKNSKLNKDISFQKTIAFNHTLIPTKNSNLGDASFRGKKEMGANSLKNYESFIFSGFFKRNEKRNSYKNVSGNDLANNSQLRNEYNILNDTFIKNNILKKYHNRIRQEIYHGKSYKKRQSELNLSFTFHKVNLEQTKKYIKPLNQFELSDKYSNLNSKQLLSKEKNEYKVNKLFLPVENFSEERKNMLNKSPINKNDTSIKNKKNIGKKIEKNDTNINGMYFQ